MTTFEYFIDATGGPSLSAGDQVMEGQSPGRGEKGIDIKAEFCGKVVHIGFDGLNHLFRLILKKDD